MHNKCQKKRFLDTQNWLSLLFYFCALLGAFLQCILYIPVAIFKFVEPDCKHEFPDQQLQTITKQAAHTNAVPAIVSYLNTA